MVYNDNMAYKTILGIPDCHHPYADYRAWKLMLQAATDIKPHTIVVGGDFIDFDSVSMHPRKVIRDVPTLADEFEAGRRARAQLDALDATLKVFLKGNHENRFDRFIVANPALRGLTSVEKELELDTNGWQVVDYHKEFQLGKLWITHDMDNAGENAHSLALRKAGASIIINHTHRIGYVVRGNIRAKPQVGAMSGWLGDASKIEYKSNGSARHEWALGFWVGTMDNDGTVFVQLCPIIDYRVCVFGKLYR